MTTKTKILNFVQKYTMIIALVLVTGFFAWRTNGKILMPQNITNIISQNAYVFVLATGMLLCILTGGNIDLSVGSVVCFVGTVGAVMMNKNMNMWVAVLFMLAVGLLIGAWQAFWIAYVKVPPFITTLAGMLIFRGLSNVVLQGKTMPVKNEAFVRIFGGGAKCYVPDIFAREGVNLNILCLVVGVIACALYHAFMDAIGAVYDWNALFDVFPGDLPANIFRIVWLGSALILWYITVNQDKKRITVPLREKPVQRL